MPTLTFYSNADGDGFTNKFNTDLPTAKSSPATGVDNSGTTFSLDFLSQDGGFYVYRGFLPFNTSSIRGGVVQAGTLSIKPSSVVSGGTKDLSLVASYQSDPGTLVLADHGSIGTTRLGTDIAVNTYGAGTYANFPLTADGIAHINTNGYSNFAVMGSADLDGNVLYGLNVSIFSREAGTADSPKLVLTYKPVAGGAFLYQFV